MIPMGIHPAQASPALAVASGGLPRPIGALLASSPLAAPVSVPEFRSNGQAAVPCLTLRNMLLAALVVLSTTAAVYAKDKIQSWVPNVLSIPKDAEVVSENEIGSTIRMFSISTSENADALLDDWGRSLDSHGYSVDQKTSQFLGKSIEFSGQGITNASISVSDTSENGRAVIEFDATLE